MYSIDPPENHHWMSWLFARHRTTIPARWISPYTDDELKTMLTALGADSTTACACSRAMVFDAQGKLIYTDPDLTHLAETRAEFDRLD